MLDNKLPPSKVKIGVHHLLLLAVSVILAIQFALFYAIFEHHSDLSVRKLTIPSTVAAADHNNSKLLPGRSNYPQGQPPLLPTDRIAVSSNPARRRKTADNASEFARAFLPWPSDVPLPCLPPLDRKNFHRVSSPPSTTNGFLFMKLMKTGGSTAAGIHLRIMREIARRGNQGFDFCRGRFDHAWGYEMMANATTTQAQHDTFAWTVVREPTRRAISQFYHFQVSRENVKPNDFQFQRYLNSEKRILRHHYLQVLNNEKIYPSIKITPQMAPDIIRKIFHDEYNFIGVTERMDETAVCLMMLLHLNMSTILYLDAKTNGGYDDGGHGQCSWIQAPPAQLSHAMQNYFHSKNWRQLVQWDELLYEAANDSLDLTIRALGVAEFETNLARFREARQLARNKCGPLEVFPCTSKGERNRNSDCLWKDSGCGVSCLDEVAKELQLD